MSDLSDFLRTISITRWIDAFVTSAHLQRNSVTKLLICSDPKLSMKFPLVGADLDFSCPRALELLRL